jgi:uncharacterized protein
MAITRVAPDRISGFVKFLALVSIIGALNWGLVGFLNFNLVDAIFGGGSREETSSLSRLIYSIVGLCGLALAITFPWKQRSPVDVGTDAAVGRHADVRP